MVRTVSMETEAWKQNGRASGGSRVAEHVYMRIICLQLGLLARTVSMETERGKDQRTVGEYTLTKSISYFLVENVKCCLQDFGACPLK